MKYMRKNSFVVCLVISAILLTSSFAMPVLAAENTGIETSSVTRSVPGYYKCTDQLWAHPESAVLPYGLMLPVL